MKYFFHLPYPSLWQFHVLIHVNVVCLFCQTFPCFVSIPLSIQGRLIELTSCFKIWSCQWETLVNGICILCKGDKKKNLEVLCSQDDVWMVSGMQRYSWFQPGSNGSSQGMYTCSYKPRKWWWIYLYQFTWLKSNFFYYIPAIDGFKVGCTLPGCKNQVTRNKITTIKTCRRKARYKRREKEKKETKEIKWYTCMVLISSYDLINEILQCFEMHKLSKKKTKARWHLPKHHQISTILIWSVKMIGSLESWWMQVQRKVFAESDKHILFRIPSAINNLFHLAFLHRDI